MKNADILIEKKTKTLWFGIKAKHSSEKKSFYCVCRKADFTGEFLQFKNKSHASKKFRGIAKIK